MFCNQCGKQIPDGSRFCNHCGVSQTAVQSAPVQSDPYFDIRHGVLVKYTGRDKNVVVPAGVVEIEKDTFTGYDMESITIPEGCKQVAINTRIKKVYLPTTIEYFYIDVKDRGPVDEIYFPSGTKVIDGVINYRNFGHFVQRVKAYLPDSLNKLHILGNNLSIDYILNTSITVYPPDVRAEIWGRQGKCRHCGGSFKRTIFDECVLKCTNCGKKVRTAAFISD